jgi:TatD DNase family protein
VLERAADAGVERLLVPGWDLRSSLTALELAERHPSMIRAAIGVHPHYAAQLDEPSWLELESLVGDPRCSAVGEIGLDFHRNLSPPDVQRAAMARQLETAARRDLPVIVHDREAHAEVTELLLAWPGLALRPARGVLHAFSGDAEMASTLTAHGFLVSFALPIAFGSAVGPRDAAARIDADAFLLETDAPYLGPDREGRNEPTTVLRVAAEVALLRGVEAATVSGDARRTFDRLIAL